MISINQSQSTPVMTTLQTHPQQVNQSQSTQLLSSLSQSDKLVFQTLTKEQDAMEALKYIRKHIGSLRRPRVFDTKRIDENEALRRLKKGDKVIVRNRNMNDLSSDFKNIDGLFKVDDLMGRKMDHGVTKAEFRLPLLFLEGHKLTPYRRGDRPRQYDAYNAYKYLDKDWRIKVDGKSVEPEDIASYVVNKGWTQSKDSGLAILAQFKQLPTNGWKVNGRSINRDVAYMAFIQEGSKLTYHGTQVSSKEDFALLMNLVGGEDNNAIGTELKSRLTRLDLNQVSTANNYYSLYKNLSSGKGISYKGNTIGSLNDAIVYDALQGTKKPTNLLKTEVQNALLYLEDGLNKNNAYQAYQSLSQGNILTFSFNGGPTGEMIVMNANSLDSLVEVKSRVVAQRNRDQFRPDFGEAKAILLERLPRFSQPLIENLSQSQAAARAAKSDIPIQEANLERARMDYDRIKPNHDRALSDYNSARRVYDQAEREYQSERRDYRWVKDRFDRAERDMYNAQRSAERAERNARSYESQARREDQLASKEPDKNKAASHRQKAASLRQRASSERSKGQRYRREAQRLRFDVDRLRNDLWRAERELSQARREYQDAESYMLSAKRDYEYQQRELRGAENRINSANNTLAKHRRTIQDNQSIEALTSQAQQALSSMQQLMNQTNDYDNYKAAKSEFITQFSALQSTLSDSTYKRLFGQGLNQQLTPLKTLVANMDKPAS